MNLMNLDTTAKTAALVAAGASDILNKTISLVNGTSDNYGCGDQIDRGEHTDQSDHTDRRSCFTDKDETNKTLLEDYMNRKTKTLNKKGRDDLNELYRKNERLRDEISNFVGDKIGLSNDQIIDKRYKYNTLYMLGREHLNKCVQSTDNTKILIEILAHHK